MAESPSEKNNSMTSKVQGNLYKKLINRWVKKYLTGIGLQVLDHLGK